jgi:Tfp pilus assembly protein PilN
MLRTNLSTRPFYNERAIHLLLVLGALLLAILTAYDALRIVSLSRQNTELSSRIDRDRAEADRLSADARRIRAGIDPDELQATALAAAEANRLIDQRTFSWTEFFNRIEETLPSDVMLTAVQPSFEQQQTVIVMTVLGRRTEDIDEFMDKLEGTRAFGQVLPTQEDPTEEGLHRVVLRAVYSGASQPAASQAAEPEQPPTPAQPRQGARR